MDADHFDAATRRWGTGSRRGLLGLGVGSGLAMLLDAAAGNARKRKKKRCRKCSACETCRRGKCRTVPDGTPCGNANTCRAGICTCTLGGDDCPRVCECGEPDRGGPPICIADAGVSAARCEECPAGTVQCAGAAPGSVTCYPACAA